MANNCHGRGVLCVLILAAALAGCAQTKSFTQNTAAEPATKSEETAAAGPPKRILLMPADVELSELTASGLPEPNAAWTKQGGLNIASALGDELEERGTTMVRYETGDDPLSPYAPQDQQVVKLHEAVGHSILRHKYIAGLELPTTRDRFDWTLGRGAQTLKQRYGSDYALFVYARDSFASAGRVAMMVTFALLGVSVPGGRTEAFASLVDLETGDIVWFNIMVKGVGDLREPESARSAMDSLLSSMPL